MTSLKQVTSEHCSSSEAAVAAVLSNLCFSCLLPSIFWSLAVTSPHSDDCKRKREIFTCFILRKSLDNSLWNILHFWWIFPKILIRVKFPSPMTKVAEFWGSKSLCVHNTKSRSQVQLWMSPPLSEAHSPGTPPSTDSELQPKKAFSRVEFPLSSAGQGQREEELLVSSRVWAKPAATTSGHIWNIPTHQLNGNTNIIDLQQQS